MSRSALAILIAVVAVVAACASGKAKGTAVAVLRSADAVRGCEMLSRLSSPTAEEGPYSEKVLRERVADLGGDTLLLLGGGGAEAWKCRSGDSARAYGDNFARTTPTAAFRPSTPTPRYGG